MKLKENDVKKYIVKWGRPCYPAIELFSEMNIKPDDALYEVLRNRIL